MTTNEFGTQPSDNSRYLWLAIGAATTMFAIGGRFDLPLAAWIAPIFLLRFSRLSLPRTGLPLIWLVTVAAALCWMWQMAVPMQPMTILGALMFGTISALPFVTDRLLANRLSPVPALLLFPATQVFSEFIMGSFSPFGTAYGLRAFTQHENLALLQFMSLAGPYAIGFLIAFCATVINDLWQNRFARERMKTIGIAYLIGLTVIVAGRQMRLAFFPTTATTVRIAGISPSMTAEDAAQQLLGGNGVTDQAISTMNPIEMRDAFAVAITEMTQSTHKAALSGAKIVVWSENAVRTTDADKPALLNNAKEIAKAENIYLLAAIKTYLTVAPYGRDETYMIDPQGNVLWTYAKAHPIPGLETYIPGNGIVPVVNTPYGRIANVICYDADFPPTMRTSADIMLVPGGDWPEMGRAHTQMASLRAIENGYALFRTDFNGMSAAYDYQGHVIAEQDTTGAGPHIFVAEVPTRGTTTLARWIGDTFAWICTLGMLALFGMAIRTRRAD